MDEIGLYYQHKSERARELRDAIQHLVNQLADLRPKIAYLEGQLARARRELELAEYTGD